VLGSQKVSQKDPLVPSEAILTVGLECSPAQQDIGVYWSLPLAHYRFHGPPKVSTHSLCTDAERISFGQLSQVALGSFLCRWNYEDYDIGDYAKTIIRIYDCLTTDQETDTVNQGLEATHYESSPRSLKFLKLEPNWLRHLAEAAKALTESSGPHRAMYNRLIGVGMRRAQNFLQNQPPIFGLTSFHDFLATLRGIEPKIQALRRLANRLDLTTQNALIRYRNSKYNDDGSRKAPQDNNKLDPHIGDVETIVPSSSPLNTPGDSRIPEPTVTISSPAPNSLECVKESDPPGLFDFVDLETSQLENPFSTHSLPNDEDDGHMIHGFASDRCDRKASRQIVEPGMGDTQSNSGNLFDYLGALSAVRQDDNGLSTLRHGGAENEQHNPIWNGVEPTRIDFTVGEDVEFSSGVNNITLMGKTTCVPDDYFSYASVVPQDRFTAKRSWEGTEVKCLVNRRWVSLNKGGSPSEHQSNEEILDLNKLEVLESHDEDVTLVGNQVITFKIGNRKTQIFTKTKFLK
jgi:hypothetical protein